MAQVAFDSGGGTVDVLSLARTGWSVAGIAQAANKTPQQVASILQQSGYNVQRAPDGSYVILTGGKVSPPSVSTTPKSTPVKGSPAAPAKTTAAPTKPTASNPGLINPNQATAPVGDTTGGYSTGVPYDPNQAAALAERTREFDITTQRDISKQNATEVDSLQQRLAALSGPKDAYADYFFSHGLLPPQGYKPAPVPLTQAQIDAYGRMGVSSQQLQQMIAGTGQPGANFGMLGNLGNSLQTSPGMPQPQQGQAPVGPQTPSNPTVQGGPLYGAVPPGGSNVQRPPTTPGGVPSMAVGGQVPGPQGSPKLAVVHGGEEVIPADQNPNATPGVQQSQPPATPGMGSDGSGAMMNTPGLHPAIAALVDAVSNLLSNPDFKPFVQAAEQTAQATPGGVQSMALGGTVNSGLPVGGTQGVNYNSGPQPADNPVMPVNNLDPYTRALYDVHGRLHPYSAQQERQMGPQGVNAVNSYVGKVQGGDVGAYTNLVDRLKPQTGAPSGSTGAISEGFRFG